jgi:hypothetical protein
MKPVVAKTGGAPLEISRSPPTSDLFDQFAVEA